MEQSPIVKVAARTGFTRSHVRNAFARHKRRLGLRRVGGFWRATPEQIREMVKVVKTESGPKYKLGETGPKSV